MASVWKLVLVSLLAQVDAGCSGSADPHPACYVGGKTIFGQGETVTVTVLDFDSESQTGHVRLMGNGVSNFACSSHVFTKDGQAIDVDLSDCLPRGVVINEIDYCSDQGSLSIKLDDTNIPWGYGKVTVEAKETANCDVVEATDSSSCSGSGDTQPGCYVGGKKVFGEGETVAITMLDFDSASQTGHVRISGDGVSNFACSSRQFSKDGQDIHVDFSDCLPSSVELDAIDYCSDQDQLSVKLNVKTIPWGYGKFTVAATRSDCVSEAIVNV